MGISFEKISITVKNYGGISRVGREGSELSINEVKNLYGKLIYV